MSHLQTALINFQNTGLLTARDTEDNIFIALKPLVTNMGLDWKSQYIKIKSDTRYGVITTPYQTNGGTQEMVSLSLDHLPAFLYSINPNRVRKDLRAKIIAFQSETFKVINEYWRGKAKLEPKQTEITIVNTTDKERVGTLEIQVYMLKNENRELRRAMNRMTYNDKHLDSEVVTFEGEPITCIPVKVDTVKKAVKKAVKVITPVKEVVKEAVKEEPKGITPGTYHRLYGKKDLVTVIAVEHGNVIFLDKSGACKVNIVDFQKFFKPAKNFLASL